MIFEIFEDPDWASSTTPWGVKIDGKTMNWHMSAESLVAEVTSRINTQEHNRRWRNGKR